MVVAIAILAIACLRPPGVPDPPLTEAELGLVEALNDLRLSPRLSAARLERLADCFDGRLLRIPGRLPLRTREGRAAVEEAIGFLLGVPAVRRVDVDPGLCRAARDHARDLGLTGRRSHEGSDGSDLGIRLARHGRLVGVAGEAIAFGTRDPADVIEQLVIDDGVLDRGHRSTLMEARYELIGVACASHLTDDVVCVLDFAQSFR